jgi:hypothetical protein
MKLTNWVRVSLTICMSFILTLTPPASASQDKSKKDETKPTGTPVIWKDSGDIATRDLLNGPGGEALKPDLSRVVFNGSEPEGYSVKWNVLDGSGKKWVVKLGNEARPETAAVRLAWAVGYVTEVNYLVPCVVIVNAPKPKKKVERCEGKGWANVRFEARPEGVKRLDNWSWKENPFAGTKELQGLVVLMALVNNWDLKDSNNKIIYVPGADGATGEMQYIISDLGATFGKTGNFITHSRNEPEKYVKTKFVEKIEGDRVKFDYNGKNTGLFDSITIEQAKWIGDLLSQLSDQQIGDAFRAANFKPDEIAVLTAEVRDRINQLTALYAPAPTPVSTVQEF